MKKKIVNNKDVAVAKSDMNMALMISDRVQLKHVRVLECSAKLLKFPSDGEMQYEVTASTRFQLDREDDSLFVFVTMALHSAMQDGGELAKITSEFLLVYKLDKWDGLTDENFVHFANHNGVFNAWSYWREMVQSMISRLQLPPLTLPTHRFGVVLPSEPTIPKKKTAKRKKVTSKAAMKKTKKKSTVKKTAKKKVSSKAK